jgi:hypothetical protein
MKLAISGCEHHQVFVISANIKLARKALPPFLSPKFVGGKFRTLNANAFMAGPDLAKFALTILYQISA